MIHFLKIENNQIIEAPEKINKNGYTIYGYNNPDNQSMLLNDGYIAYPENKYYYEIINGEIKERENMIPPRTIFNKLEIRRKLREAGLQQDFDNILDSNPEFKKDWQDAVQINLNEETIINAIQSGLIPENIINAIQD